MNRIREYISQLVELEEEEWNLFASKLRKESIPKNTCLLHIGEIEKYLSFVQEGIVRMYIPQDENDLTFGFVFENEFVTAYDSLITQRPSQYQVETLTDTILWKISFDDLQEVYAQTKNGNAIGRRMAETRYLIKSKRELDLLSKSAEQRYIELFTSRPELFKLIPLKYIASYIGVTPQGLSRIRKRIT